MKQAHAWVSSTLFFVACTILCGFLYTGLVTGVAQLAFPYQANGSIIRVDGVSYGSELVGQQFGDEDHMWGRVTNVNATTFTTEDGRAAVWYGPSNASPASEEYAQAIAERVDLIRQAHPEKGDAPIPSDLVTCSGSGFDPHVSPAAAEYQVERLARNTGKSTEQVRSIVEECTEKPFLGLFGEARVNVLKVNLMLEGIL